MRFAAAGVDIGHSAIKLVELEGDRLVRWSVVPLPPGAVENGVVRDIATVAGCIRLAAGEAHLVSRTVHTALSGATCIIRRLRLPEVSDRDLRGVMRWQAERILPYRFEDSVVDYEVLARSGNGASSSNGASDFMDILMVGVRAEVVQAQVAAVEAAGLRVAGLDVKPLARLRACRPYIREPGVLLVGLGSQRIELTAADVQGLIFTRTVPLSAGVAVTGAAEHAEVSSGVTALLADEAARSLRFFETQTDVHASAVVVTGGGAEEVARIAALWQWAEGLPVVSADPLVELTYNSSVAPPPGSRLCVAVGLAMRGLPSLTAGVAHDD